LISTHQVEGYHRCVCTRSKPLRLLHDNALRQVCRLDLKEIDKFLVDHLDSIARAAAASSSSQAHGGGGGGPGGGGGGGGGAVMDAKLFDDLCVGPHP